MKFTTPHVNERTLILREEDLHRELQKPNVQALEQLLHEAEKVLSTPPMSVTHKSKKPPSGNMNDYVSYGAYWWPDPQQPGGLPYINRDGEFNPETQSEISDAPRFQRFASCIDTLATAYRFSGDERYAQQAIVWLRVWFLDSETRMNPHMNHGQIIPGLNLGRCVGIIDTNHMHQILDGITMLANSPAMTHEFLERLKDWFREFLHWLTESEFGIQQSQAPNNIGAWYDAVTALIALFVGEREIAMGILTQAGHQRIEAQIASDGSQPHELKRTRSLHYSIFSLTALFHLARLGEDHGIDLWNHASSSQPHLKKALDFIAPFSGSHAAWPYPEKTEFKKFRLYPLLHSGYRIYGNQKYLWGMSKLCESFPTMLYRLQFPYPEKAISTLES